jgi:hypothetical protein
MNGSRVSHHSNSGANFLDSQESVTIALNATSYSYERPAFSLAFGASPVQPVVRLGAIETTTAMSTTKVAKEPLHPARRRGRRSSSGSGESRSGSGRSSASSNSESSSNGESSRRVAAAAAAAAAATSPAPPRPMRGPAVLPHAPMRPSRPHALRRAFERIAAAAIERDGDFERGATTTGTSVVLECAPAMCRVPGVLITTVRLLPEPPRRRQQQQPAAPPRGVARARAAAADDVLPPAFRSPLVLGRTKFGPRANTGPVPRTFTLAQKWEMSQTNRRLSECVCVCVLQMCVCVS